MGHIKRIASGSVGTSLQTIGTRCGGCGFVGGVLELADALAKTTRDLRDALGSEKEEHDEEDGDDLERTEAAHGGEREEVDRKYVPAPFGCPSPCVFAESTERASS